MLISFIGKPGISGIIAPAFGIERISAGATVTNFCDTISLKAIRIARHLICRTRNCSLLKLVVAW